MAILIAVLIVLALLAIVIHCILNHCPHINTDEFECSDYRPSDKD